MYQLYIPTYSIVKYLKKECMIDNIFHMFLFSVFYDVYTCHFFIKGAQKGKKEEFYEIIFEHCKRGLNPLYQCHRHVYYDNRVRSTISPIYTCMGQQHDICRMSWYSDVHHKCVCTKGFY